MRLALAEGPHGWCGAFDIPGQGVLGLAVPVERTATGFRVRLPVQTVATIELEADAEIKLLSGVFAQAGFRGPIRFEFDPAARIGNARRPQDPQPPFPYETREVAIAHPAGHTLAGTLSMPRAAASVSSSAAASVPVPALVLVSGSGPQNRDEELLGHRPFAVLADAFTRAGFAVLRYDDRGVGASTGRFAGATTLDFASDADIASEWLKRQPGVDPARVGIVGHSEGAVIAPFVAVWQQDAARTAGKAAVGAAVHPLAFIVLLAPPAETGGETLTRQTARMYELTGVDAAPAARAVAAHEAVMQAVAALAAPDALRPRVDVLVRAQLALQTTGLPPASELDRAVDGALAQITDPWTTEFIRLDPAVALARLSTPTLAAWGSKDFQVVAEPNRTRLAALVAQHAPPVEMRVYDGLNHLFQPAGTGLIDEYGTIDTTFDPKALADIVAWLRARAGLDGRAGAATGGAATTTAATSNTEGTNAAAPGEMPRRIWTPDGARTGAKEVAK
jgi:pimeloyl-ACP methyl ester carboxylesterase